jgi:hypothetical protein
VEKNLCTNEKKSSMEKCSIEESDEISDDDTWQMCAHKIAHE